MLNDYYFFSLGYTKIFAILSIIEKKSIRESNINIIVTLKSTKLFWQKLIRDNSLKWKLIFLNTHVDGRLRNPLTWIRIRKLTRKLFKNNFQFVHNSNIYFFGSSFALDMFALIKMLSKTNYIYFLDYDTKRIYLAWCKYFNFRYIILKIIYNLIYKLDIKFININERPIATLSDQFFSKAKIIKLKMTEYSYDVEIFKKYILTNKEVIINKRVLLLDDDCYLFSYCSGEELRRILNKLKKMLDSYFLKSEILFKKHPNDTFYNKQFNSIYDDYTEYPYYIPAERIFLEQNIKLVVGGFSNVLGIASKHYNIKSIAYIKLIPFRHEEFKDHVIRILKEESDNKIDFPDSWEELNSLLKDNAIREENIN
jgi:hypothetical protein